MKQILQGLSSTLARIVLSLLLVMVAGIGNVWADDELAYTVSFKSQTSGTSDGSTAKTSTADLISDGSDYMTVSSASNIYNGKSGYGIKGGSGSKRGVISLATTTDGNVSPSKIVVNACYYGSDAKDLAVYINGTSSTSAAQSYTCDLTSSLTDFEITIDASKVSTLTSLTLQASAASNARFYIKSISVYKAAATIKTDPTFSIADLTVENGDDIKPVIATNNTDSYTVTYSSNNEDVVMADGSELVTMGTGDATITATMGATTNFNEATTTFKVTVNAATKTLSEIVVSGTPAEFWKGDSFNHNGITVTAMYDDESEEDVTADATFSGYDMTTAGEQTVTATYKGKTDSYTINVQTIANTQETAYTVDEIKAIVDAKHDLSTAVFVKGTVSSMYSTSLASKGYLSYYISADGTTTGNQFEFYQNYKGANSEAWTALTDVQVGDDVIGYGTAILYTTATGTTKTYEFTAGNYLVKHNLLPTVSIADIAVAMGGTITPEVTTNIPAGSYTVLYSSNDDDVVTTNEEKTTLVTGTKTGTSTITATISATGYKTVTTTFNVTVTSNATLSSITVGGNLSKSTYTLGDEFSFEGLTATGNYSDETTADLTSTVIWSVEPATLTAATTSVTVKATSGEIYGTKEYAVTVEKKGSNFTIEDMEIGKNATDVEVVVSGAVPELAANSLSFEITEGEDYITLDTSTSGHAKISAVAPGTATVQATYPGDEEYGEYSTTFKVTVIDASMATYTFSSFTSADDVTLTDLNGFTITLSKGTGSTKPAWSSSQARIYAKGTLTVKAPNADIKSIVYEYTVNANSKGSAPTIDGVAGTTTAGTWNSDTKTWSGSDSEVTFSTSGSAGNVGFTKLTITYAQGTKTETYLAWSASEATVTMDANDNVFPTLTTTPKNLEGVTYESSATTVATIAEDGTITLVAPGTTKITAKYAGDDTHTEATPASYTLTVNEAPFAPVVAEAGYESVDFTSVYSEVTSLQEMTTYKGTSFKMEFSKGTNSNAPKYYANGTAVRVYAGNTITVTGAENIKKVVVNYVSGYVDANATTILDGTTATITFSKTCRFTSITVFYKNNIDFSESTTVDDATIEALATTAKGTNTLIYAPDGSAAEGENVIVKSGDSYTCANFVVADIASAITVPEGKSFTATSAKYTRTASELSTETTYGTLCLPYAVKNTDDITYLRLAGGTENSLSFEPITDDKEIEANTPCLFRRNATGDVNATATNVKVVAAETVEQEGTDYKLVGITQPTIICASAAEKDALDAETLASCNNNAVVAEKSYYIKDSKFYSTNGYFRSKGFRAYIVATSQAARANTLSIGIVDPETTGIQYIEHKNGTVDMIFDVAGRRQAQAQKGLNIINGKKVIK